MAIHGVNPKCYILALFVRDDGARFLLGDDPFEFKDNQLHFQQNTMANDVVEVQGNDGYLLAGQVRRPGTQMFDGYVCNGTNSKEEVEVKRRAFLQFFRRSHFYKVIYVFPNGTAIQRKQGFLVDDPTVQELYQQYPEYHVALNFEDVNYYTYEEDEQGHEIYAKEAIVALARGGATGGLIWDSYGVVWEDAWSLPLSISGVQFQILNNAGVRAPIDNVELLGDTYQQTYSGKNLFDISSFEMGTIDGVTIDPTCKFRIQNGDNPIAVQPNTAYTISAILSNQVKGYRIGLHLCDSNKGFISDLGWKQLSTSSFTFTTPSNCYYVMLIGSLSTTSNTVSTSTTEDKTTFNDPTAFQRGCVLQFELGSQPTSYEPYVGGIPVPNPDYPEPINVVTGTQNVWVHGKNILHGMSTTTATNNGVTHTWDNNTVTFSGSASGAYSNVTQNNFGTIPAGTYTFSTPTPSGVFNTNLRVRYDGTNYNYTIPKNGTSVTFTIPKEASTFLIYIAGLTAGTKVSGVYSYMLERNSTVTTYEPYQGANYTIDLGAIELCKIGDYQDYIYKSGEDWYVHKACDSSLLGGFTWTAQNTYNSTTIKKMSTDGLSGVYLPPTNSSSTILAYCTHYQAATEANVNLRNMGVSGRTNGNDVFIYDPDYNTSSSPSNFKTWLSNNSVALYYVLATATDTKITDATLAGQLEALDAMKLFIGENNVLVSTPTPNLPATLAFDYYTKFAAIGAEWEEGGTKGATIVNVDAIDNTYPVWELTGPATNPTLSVLTTNTTLTYNGTITASQKLVIDMFNKTAALNGTSVIGNISGDFVYMAPGTNRVAYTAGNTDAPDSTIYWQEVVG